MPRLHFEDFAPGSVAEYGPRVVTRDEMVAFARAFDPQPMHLDETSAAGSMAGTLIASGWHTCALGMRLIADGFLNDAVSLGAPGVEEVRWLKPLHPGEAVSLRRHVIEAKPSRSRPERGSVLFRLEIVVAGEPIMTQTNWIMFGRRDAPPAGTRPARPADRVQAAPGADSVDRGSQPRAVRDDSDRPGATGFDDVLVGETMDLGEHIFTAEEIVAFARDFDPQPFHLSEEGARTGPFGRLCASGWHTAATWMRLMAQARARRIERETAEHGGAARLGPSPGVRNLVWRRPVYAGDTIRYRSRITGKRGSTSRPGWGLVFHRNEGVNQHGETVFGFDGCVFWERSRA